MSDIVIFKDEKQQIIEEKSSKIRTGFGTIYQNDVGYIYTGEITDGLEDGVGKASYANGTEVEGNYSHGLLKGYAKLIQRWTFNGEDQSLLYDGIWNETHDILFFEGECTGRYASFQGKMKTFRYDVGVLKYSNGVTLDGSFNYDSNITFIGKIQSKNMLYSGQAKMNADNNHPRWDPHGKGTLTSPDGFTYTGSFSNGKYDGMGTLRSSEGFLKGMWSHGTLMEIYENTLPSRQPASEVRSGTVSEKGKHYESTGLHGMLGNQGINAVDEMYIRQKYGDGFSADMVIESYRK